LGLFSRKKGAGGEMGSIDKFKMRDACKVLEEMAGSLDKQGVETRVLDEYVVDVDVDTENNVVTITYDEGREFFRKNDDGEFGRIEPGG
jgi:hypothetical protein